jgi:Crp-like helix-turn-helix domain
LRELLAQMIGVQRSATSIVANALQRADIIRYIPEHIEITDLEGFGKRPANATASSGRNMTAC